MDYLIVIQFSQAINLNLIFFRSSAQMKSYYGNIHFHKYSVSESAHIKWAKCVSSSRLQLIFLHQETYINCLPHKSHVIDCMVLINFDIQCHQYLMYEITRTSRSQHLTAQSKKHQHHGKNTFEAILNLNFLLREALDLIPKFRFLVELLLVKI